jgi:hypothetical protein
VGVNVTFDLMIASAIGTSLLGADVASSARTNPAPRQALVLAAVALSSALLARSALRGQAEFAALRQHATSFQALVERLRAVPGPVACESLDLCYWAGQGFALDAFNVGQALATGALDPEAVLAPIRERRYSAILVGDPAHAYGATASNRLPADVNAAIGAFYRPDACDPLCLYRPR